MYTNPQARTPQPPYPPKAYVQLAWLRWSFFVIESIWLVVKVYKLQYKFGKYKYKFRLDLVHKLNILRAKTLDVHESIWTAHKGAEL